MSSWESIKPRARLHHFAVYSLASEVSYNVFSLGTNRGCWVTKSCPTLCDPMDCIIPSFHYLQVPMQYCSLQHQTLFPPSDTSTTEHRFRFGLAALFFLELLVIALCSSRSLLNTYWVSLKVHLGFSVRCHGKSWTNFLANPIVRREQNKMNVSSWGSLNFHVDN